MYKGVSHCSFSLCFSDDSRCLASSQSAGFLFFFLFWFSLLKVLHTCVVLLMSFEDSFYHLNLSCFSVCWSHALLQSVASHCISLPASFTDHQFLIWMSSHVSLFSCMGCVGGVIPPVFNFILIFRRWRVTLGSGFVVDLGSSSSLFPAPPPASSCLDICISLGGLWPAGVPCKVPLAKGWHWCPTFTRLLTESSPFFNMSCRILLEAFLSFVAL